MTYKQETRRHPSVWILAGDRMHARVISADWPTLENGREIDDFVCAEAGLPTSAVYSDSLGRNHDPMGRSYSEEPDTDHRHATATAFAHQVAEALERGRTENRFGHLILVAPPLFLGALRSELSEPLRRMVEQEYNQDLVALKMEALLDRLRESIAEVSRTSAESGNE